MSKPYAEWTDREWNELIARCRAEGVGLNEKEIRDAAWGYMHHGADGGGNKYGVRGTVVALNVDKISTGR
jgi:hypothetical protein